MWSPILLRDAVDLTVSPLSTFGAVASLDTRKFVNPNRSPMIIDQIRFYPNMRTYTGTPNLASPLASFWVELKLGAISLTRNFIPIGVLAPRYNGYQVPISVSGLGIAYNLSNYLDAVLTWHLPRPLYVPPGLGISARFIQQKPISTYNTPITPVSISMAAAGRSLPQDYVPPAEIDVPWASAAVCNNQAVSRYVSNDADLSNPYNTELRLAQIVGLNAASRDGSSPAARANRAGVTIQITSSSAKMIIRDPTPFELIFPSCRGVMETKTVLQPGEFWRAEFEAVAPTNALSVVPTTTEFTAVSIIGTRKVPTPRPVQP